jgi:TRAP transporter TAXI family solute receptor
VRTALARAGAVALAPGLLACDVREYARRHGGKLRLSIATGPVGGTYYVLGAAMARAIGRHLANVEATAEVTSASVDNLKLLATGRADLAFTIAPTLYDAVSGGGAFARFGRVPARVLVPLHMNLMHLVTLDGLGLAALADLRGHVVSVGPAGSGTEETALRILRAGGLDPDRDVRRQSLGPSVAADAMKDGKLDAFFWSGGARTAAIVDLAVSVRGRLRLLPLADLAAPLQPRGAPALYVVASNPRDSYPGLPADVPTVGTPNLLAVDASMHDALAYDLTRALFERQAELVETVRAAEEMALPPGTGRAPAAYHPGAIRYSRERGAWME